MAQEDCFHLGAKALIHNENGQLLSHYPKELLEKLSPLQEAIIDFKHLLDKLLLLFAVFFAVVLSHKPSLVHYLNCSIVEEPISSV